MSFKELTKYRMQLLKVLSENEFSADFHIFVTEAVQDAQYISEEDAEKHTPLRANKKKKRKKRHAPLAQLDRASDCGSGGWKFKSS